MEDWKTWLLSSGVMTIVWACVWGCCKALRNTNINWVDDEENPRQARARLWERERGDSRDNLELRNGFPDDRGPGLDSPDPDDNFGVDIFEG